MTRIHLLVLLFPFVAVAQEINPQWKFGLTADFYLEYSNLPTSKMGQTEFDFGELEIRAEAEIVEGFQAFFNFALSDERSLHQKNYLSEIPNAWLQYQDPNFTSLIHEAGLIYPYWHRYQGLLTRFEIFGQASWSQVRRYGFLPEGDVGYQGQWNLSDTGFLVFGLVNGEENRSQEVGASKEVFLSYMAEHESRYAGLWLSYGKVDLVDKDIENKARVLLRLQQKWGRFALGIEGLWAQDPSVEYESDQRAEGMTFDGEPRQVVTEAGRLDLMYQLTPKQSVLIRYDHLRPDLSDKSIQSWMGALLLEERPHFSWGGFYENTQYGDRHSSRAKQLERVRLGLRLDF